MMMYLRCIVFTALFTQSVLISAAARKQSRPKPIYCQTTQKFSPIVTAAYAQKNFYMVLSDELISYTPATSERTSLSSLTPALSSKISAIVPVDGGKKIVLALGSTIGEVCTEAPQSPSFLGVSDDPDPEWPSSDDSEVIPYFGEHHEPSVAASPIQLLCATPESVFSASARVFCRWSIARRRLEQVEKHTSPVVAMTTDAVDLFRVYQNGTVCVNALCEENQRTLQLNKSITVAAIDLPERTAYAIDTDGDLTVIALDTLKVRASFHCPADAQPSAMATKNHAVFVADTRGDVHVYDTRDSRSNKVASCKAPVSYMAYDRNTHDLYTLAAMRDGHTLTRHWM